LPPSKSGLIGIPSAAIKDCVAEDGFYGPVLRTLQLRPGGERLAFMIPAKNKNTVCMAYGLLNGVSPRKHDHAGTQPAARHRFAAAIDDHQIYLDGLQPDAYKTSAQGGYAGSTPTMPAHARTLATAPHHTTCPCSTCATRQASAVSALLPKKTA